jgi:hypothetical protein
MRRDAGGKIYAYPIDTEPDDKGRGGGRYMHTRLTLNVPRCNPIPVMTYLHYCCRV